MVTSLQGGKYPLHPRISSLEGLPKNLFEGAADIYRLVETSPLGKEIVEDRKLGTSAENVADVLANFLGK